MPTPSVPNLTQMPKCRNEEVVHVPTFWRSVAKETGQLVPGTEHTFLGRRLRHRHRLEVYGMKTAKPVATTGMPLSSEEHSVYRTAVAQLLCLALVRGDIAYATKELSRDVTAPTMQSVQSANTFCVCAKTASVVSTSNVLRGDCKCSACAECSARDCCKSLCCGLRSMSCFPEMFHEVSAAMSRMDCGLEITRVSAGLDWTAM